MKVPGLFVGVAFWLGLSIPCLAAQLEDLFDAAAAGDLATIEKLQAAGLDIKAKDRDGWTLIMHGAYRGQAPLVQAMIARGVPVDAISYYGETALMIAVRQGHASIVRALLDAGANADITTKDGDTAVRIAEREGFPAILAMLREVKSAPGTGRRAFNLDNANGPARSLLAKFAGEWSEVGDRIEIRVQQLELRAADAAVQVREVRFALCQGSGGERWDFSNASEPRKLDTLLLPGRALERRNLDFSLPKPKALPKDAWLCALIGNDDGIVAIHGNRQRLGS